MELDGNSKEPIPTPAFLAYMAQGGHQVLDFRRYFPSSYSPPQQNGTGDEAIHFTSRLDRFKMFQSILKYFQML